MKERWWGYLYSVVVCISELTNICVFVKVREYLQSVPVLLPAINLQLVQGELHLTSESQILPKHYLTVFLKIIALGVHTAYAIFILTGEIETIFL